MPLVIFTKGALIPTKFFLRKIDRFVLKKSTDHLRETVLFFRQACLLKFASLMYLNFISFASIQPIMSSNTFLFLQVKSIESSLDDSTKKVVVFGRLLSSKHSLPKINLV